MNTLDIVRVARDAQEAGRDDVAAALLEDAAPDFEYVTKTASRCCMRGSIGEFVTVADGTSRLNGLEHDRRLVNWTTWIAPRIAPRFSPRGKTATLTLASGHQRTLRVGERLLLQTAAGLPTSAEIRSVNVGVDGSTTIEYDVV